MDDLLDKLCLFFLFFFCMEEQDEMTDSIAIRSGSKVVISNSKWRKTDDVVSYNIHGKDSSRSSFSSGFCWFCCCGWKNKKSGVFVYFCIQPVVDISKSFWVGSEVLEFEEQIRYQPTTLWDGNTFWCNSIFVWIPCDVDVGISSASTIETVELLSVIIPYNNPIISTSSIPSSFVLLEVVAVVLPRTLWSIIHIMERV